MTKEQAGQMIVIALDNMSLDQCTKLFVDIGADVNAGKIHDLWDSEGPRVVELLKKASARRVMVDLKLHDIPNTVAKRAAAVRKAGADILTVHAKGGIEMMMAAVEHGPAEIFAITELTSLTEEDIHLGSGQPEKASVLRLAQNAKLAGVTGIVCSPHEVAVLAKRSELKGLQFKVSGIRPAGKEAADQKRFDTPANAIKAGAHKLVIGRAITEAEDPVAALHSIVDEIVVATT